MLSDPKANVTSCASRRRLPVNDLELNSKSRDFISESLSSFSFLPRAFTLDCTALALVAWALKRFINSSTSLRFFASFVRGLFVYLFFLEYLLI